MQRLARALVEREHSVTVVHDVDAFNLMSGGTRPSAPTPDDGVEVIRLESSIGRLSPILAQQTGEPTIHRSTLRSLFRDRSFDVVNFHNASLIGGPGIFGIAGQSAKIYSAHEHWLVCPTHVLWRHERELCTGRQCIRCQIRYSRPPQMWRYTDRLEDNLSKIDAFIAMSEFSRSKHAGMGFAHPMHVVPPFVPARAKVEWGRPHDRPYFFFAGRLEKIKGVQTVIRRMRSIPDADLVVAGKGSYRSELESLGGVNVRFVGSLGTDELSRYYSHAIATVVPSITYETFGLTLIESFSHGTPVIARQLGPFPEIVHKSGAGLLFSTDTELDSAMQRLLHDDGLRMRLSANAVASHRMYWCDDAVLPQYLQVVEQAMGRRR